MKLDNQTIMMIVVAIVLGMLVANMFKEVCGCKVVEGQDNARPRAFIKCDPADIDNASGCQWLPAPQRAFSPPSGGPPPISYECGRINYDVYPEAVRQDYNPCLTNNPTALNYSESVFVLPPTSTDPPPPPHKFGVYPWHTEVDGTTRTRSWKDTICCGKPAKCNTFNCQSPLVHIDDAENTDGVDQKTCCIDPQLLVDGCITPASAAAAVTAGR